MTAQTVLADSPSLPENFRALVYSKTAAELFWDRADTPGLVYQISRDSTLIGETDGTSFFVDGLSDARGHDFTVHAIDAAGTTSTAWNVFVNTGTPEDPVNPPRDDTGVLKNVKVAVYSENAAELSWDRPSVSDDVVSVEVLRNEDSVGTTYGTSYYDDTRTPNSNQSCHSLCNCVLTGSDRNASKDETSGKNRMWVSVMPSTDRTPDSIRPPYLSSSGMTFRS